MDWIASLAEEKIRESIRKGELDNLPGAGKPLRLDDDSFVPKELRTSFRIMKNAGMIPEEMQLRKEMLTLQDLLVCCQDEQQRIELRRQLSVKQLRYQSLMSQRGWTTSAAFTQYEDKLRDKLTGK